MDLIKKEGKLMKKLFTTLFICVSIAVIASGCGESAGATATPIATQTLNIRTTVTPQPTLLPPEVDVDRTENSETAGWAYIVLDLDDDGKGDAAELYGYRGTDKEITIPKTVPIRVGVDENDKPIIEQIPVVKIAESVLCYESKRIENDSQYHSDITKVTIPSWINENIPLDMFAQCKYLEEVVIEPGADFVINNNVLYSKDMSILYYVFNKDIASFTIPDSVKTIGGGAFRGCRTLTSITIPGTVERLGGYVFSSCTGLKTVTVSEGVKYIGNNSFSGCKNLEMISLPESLITLGDGAFSFTDKLVIHVVKDSRVDKFFKERDEENKDSQTTAKYKDHVKY